MLEFGMAKIYQNIFFSSNNMLQVKFFIRPTGYVYNINPKFKCQEENEIKDRNFFHLSVELGDNQGAIEAALLLRDSSLSLKRHNRGSVWEAGREVSVGLNGCYAAVPHLLCDDFVPSVN